MAGRKFENELFSGCRFTRLARAQFIHCDLRESEIAVRDIRDMLGVTATLDCFTFEGVKLSEVAVDGLLFLLTLAAIPQEKKDAIRALIPSARLEFFDRIFERIE